VGEVSERLHLLKKKVTQNFKTLTVPRQYPLVLLVRHEIEKMKVGWEKALGQ
jgi:hypothetical protein